MFGECLSQCAFLDYEKEKLDLIGKNMVYWTSLGKEELLDLLEEKDDILYPLGKMMIYWSFWAKTRDTWSCWGKG